jgi:dTDP-4-dehydrorhamnose 3,5-epimerase-like enzyme
MYKLINFQVFGDNRGSLVSLESFKNIPFEIKRSYYIFDTKPNISRGMHAHKDLKQLLITLSGSCEIILDDVKNKNKILLNSPRQGLLIEGLIWREMQNFSSDCVLLVLANKYYEEDDYIRNYNDFIKIVNI